MTALLILILVVLAMAASSAWIVMVLWGALAPTFGVKTIGYGTAFLVCIALSVVGSFLRGHG